MGDDGEKFGAWPTTYEHCWGARPLGRAVLRGARGERRLADDGHAVRVAGRAQPPIGRVYVPTVVVRRDGRMGAAGRRDACVFAPAPPASRRRSTVPRRAGCAAGSGATSRSSTARSTTSTSRCCGRRRRSRRCRRARRATRAIDHLHRGPVERLLLARAVRRHLHRHMRLAHVRAPDRGRGPRRTTRSGPRAPAELRRPRPRRPATRCGSATPGQVVAVKPARAAGSATGTSAPRGTRWRRCCAGGPRPTTRRCAPTRPRRDDRARRRGAGSRRRRSATSAARPLDPRHRRWSRRPASRRGSSTTTTSGARGWCGSSRPDDDARGVATAAAAELGDCRDGAWRSTTLAPGQVVARRATATRRGPAGHGRARRSASAAAAWRRRSSIDVELAPPAATRPSSARFGLELSRAPAGWRRQPVGVVRRRRRARSAHDRRGHGRGRRRDRLRQRLGGHRGAGHGRAGGRRLVEPDRDRLELGGRASSASTRAAACCSRGRCGSPRARPAGSRCARRSASRATAQPTEAQAPA